MTYKDQLLDPRWQKKRLLILERDEWSCRLCFDTQTTLNVHHNAYAEYAWDISDDDLVTYCQHCHSLIEFLKTNSDEVLNGLAVVVKVFKIRRTQSDNILLVSKWHYPKIKIQTYHIVELQKGDLQYKLGLAESSLIDFLNIINAENKNN